MFGMVPANWKPNLYVRFRSDPELHHAPLQTFIPNIPPLGTLVNFTGHEPVAYFVMACLAWFQLALLFWSKGHR